MISLIISLACVDNIDTEVATEPASNAVPVETRAADERTSNPDQAASETSQAGPVGSDAVRSLLMARHDDDVAGVDAFETHENVQESLRWLAENDELLLVQSRALDSLGLWDTDDNAAYLLAVVQDEAALEKKRAAAVLGLAHMDLSARADVRDGLLAQVTGPERLALESVAVLAQVPEARDGLNALASSPDLAPSVKQALADLGE